MHERPSAAELLTATARFLNEVAAPGLSGQAAFHARVAANALALVERELAARPAADARHRADLVALLGREDTLEALNAQLCAAIRSGAMDWKTPGLLAALKAATIDQVAIDQPNYSGLAVARADTAT
jgi:hypothetical protein